MRSAAVLLVLSACIRPPGATPPDRATTPSRAEPVAAPQPPVAALAASDTHAPPEPPASAHTLSAIGTAPSWLAVLELARSLGLRKPTKAAAPVGLGDGRWAAAIRTTDREDGDDGPSFSTHLLVVDSSAERLQLVDRRALVSWDEIDPDQPRSAPVAVFAADYDADGEREILVRFGFTLMLCGIGEVGRRELRIYALDDSHLRPQVALTLDDRVYFGASTGRESFADSNKDGRPDLMITERTDYEDVDNENGGKPIRNKRELTYTYRPEKDDYVLDGKAPATGAQAFDFRIWDTCEEGVESPGSWAL